MKEGIVFKASGSWYSVRGVDGHFYDCRLAGKFRMKGVKSTSVVVVGDSVFFQVESGQDTAVIKSIIPRKNYVVRRSVNLSKQTHIIAANITQLFVFFTVKAPVTTLTFLDRVLVGAAAQNIPAVLLFNKIDLLADSEKDTVEKIRATYEKIGYSCIDLVAKKGIGLQSVKEKMNGKTNLFMGHSGVGKTTLINAIAPELDLKTKAVSRQHSQGKHTTTFSQMHPLKMGDAAVVDTPGIRGFGMLDFEVGERLSDYFLEFYQLQNDCKFNDCRHQNEPACAIKKAVETGEISKSRYENYLQIMGEGGEKYR